MTRFNNSPQLPGQGSFVFYVCYVNLSSFVLLVVKCVVLIVYF